MTMINVTTNITDGLTYHTEITKEMYDEFIETVKKWNAESEFKWTIEYENNITIVKTTGVEIRLEEED